VETEKMNTLGIVTSPRREGNTAKIVEAIIEGAEEKGSETEMIYLGDLNISPCNSCDACKETGNCVLEDDMQPIYKALERADNIVLGTPIYFDHISAQCKILIDRLYSFNWVKKLNDGKRAVLVITYEENKPEIYDSVLEWLEGRLSYYHGIETLASVKAYNTIITPVDCQPKILEKARLVGKKIVF
jgi:multimeric flavodoxin WrbA